MDGEQFCCVSLLVLGVSYPLSFFVPLFLLHLLLQISSSSSSSRSDISIIFYFASVTELLLSHPTGLTFLQFSHPSHGGRAWSERAAAGHLVAGWGKMQQYQNMSLSYHCLSPQKNCTVTKKEKPGESLHCGRLWWGS